MAPGAADAPAEEKADLSSVCFCDGVWINAYGPPGNDADALAYLRQSPFWDAGSANEALAQRQVTGAPPPSPADITALAASQGLAEHRVLRSQPPHLYVVQKREHGRGCGADGRPVEQLYCLDGVAYMCPSAGAVVGSRITRAAFHLSEALSLLSGEADEGGSTALQSAARAEADVSADAAARRDFALSAARDAPPPADEAQALEHARVAALLQGALEAVDKAAEQKQAANDDAEVTAMEV